MRYLYVAELIDHASGLGLTSSISLSSSSYSGSFSSPTWLASVFARTGPLRYHGFSDEASRDGHGLVQKVGSQRRQVGLVEADVLGLWITIVIENVGGCVEVVSLLVGKRRLTMHSFEVGKVHPRYFVSVGHVVEALMGRLAVVSLGVDLYEIE